MKQRYSFEEYQNQSKKTAVYPIVGVKGVYTAIGLAGETGEVLEKIKKTFRDNNGIMTAEMKEEIKKEMGDVLWYLSQLATDLGMSFEEIATNNIAKINSRKARNKVHGSGDNR